MIGGSSENFGKEGRRELRHFNLTMRKNPMTKNSVQHSELLATAGAADILREFVGFVAQSLMELDVENRCGASARNAATGERIRVTTTANETGIRAPAQWPCTSRNCARAATFCRTRRTTEKTLAAVIQEAYVQSISPPSVDELVQAIGTGGLSKNQVLRLCTKIHERVTFLAHPIAGDYSYLWIDAIYLKVREARRIASLAAIIAIGANTDGHQMCWACRSAPPNRAVLDRFPAQTHAARPALHQTHDLRCPRGVQGGRALGDLGRRAALSHPFHAQPALARAMPDGVVSPRLRSRHFCQTSERTARDQRRIVVDQLRERLPKIATHMPPRSIAPRFTPPIHSSA